MNFYTFMPEGAERERKQTRHRLEGINVLVSGSFQKIGKVHLSVFVDFLVLFCENVTLPNLPILPYLKISF